jgi:hypothetical protein
LYQIVEEKEQLSPKYSAVSGVPVQWHDNFRRELPGHGDVR